MSQERNKENYAGFYISENLLLYPGQLGIVKLSFPRLFLRFEYDSCGYFADYNEWKDSLINVQWLDPNDKPTNEDEIDEVLTDCWNFLALHEEEEERLFDENNGYEDDDF